MSEQYGTARNDNDCVQLHVYEVLRTRAGYSVWNHRWNRLNIKNFKIHIIYPHQEKYQAFKCILQGLELSKLAIAIAHSWFYMN